MHTALPSVPQLGLHVGLSLVLRDANYDTAVKAGTEHRWPQDGQEFEVQVVKYATRCFSSEKESVCLSSHVYN